MLQVLFQAVQGGADFIIAGLGLLQLFVQSRQVFPSGGQPGFQLALLRDDGLQGGFLCLQRPRLVVAIGIQEPPAQGQQFRLEAPFGFLVAPIVLGRLGLLLQVLKLLGQLVTHIVQAVQVLAGMLHAQFGFPAAFLVFGDAGRFFQENPQVLRFGLDQPGDRTLLDDGVAARSQAGAQEDIDNIAAAAAGAVQKIMRLAIATELALDGNLVIVRPGTAQPPLTVVEHQFDSSLSDRFTAGGAVENDIGQRLAAQGAGGAFAHHPAHGVDDIGFAAAVGTDHAHQIAGQVQGGGVHEGLETGQFDFGQTHGRGAVRAL